MAKFNFNLREAGTSTETAIHLVIRWNNNRLVYPTKESIYPKFWESDPDKRNYQRAKETKTFPEHPEFNARLNFLESSAKDVFRQYQNDNENKLPSIEEFRDLLNKKLNPEAETIKLDLFRFTEKFIEESRVRVNEKTGKTFSKDTIQIYRNTLQVLRNFKQLKRKRIDFDTIDLDFYHDFTEYLTKDLGFANNTIGKHMKTLKTFLNEATERGLSTNLSHKSKRFRVIREDTESIYLTESELAEICALDLSDNPRLDRIRDLFIVGCWTGLRFSDFSNIQPENIKIEEIELETQKTGETVVIPIHPTVKKIMAKYKGKYPNSLPPAISNVKMNQYLKELGHMVESLHAKTSTSITKGGLNISTNRKKFELVTTHTARRSFASNLYLSGFPAISIMKITGHRTEKAFMRYIKITPNENANLLRLHWQEKQRLVAV